jgi:hypothetical protein
MKTIPMNDQELHPGALRTSQLIEEIIEPRFRAPYVGTHSGRSQSQIEFAFHREDNISPERHGFANGEIRLRGDFGLVEAEEGGDGDLAVEDYVGEIAV